MYDPKLKEALKKCTCPMCEPDDTDTKHTYGEDEDCMFYNEGTCEETGEGFQCIERSCQFKQREEC